MSIHFRTKIKYSTYNTKKKNGGVPREAVRDIPYQFNQAREFLVWLWVVKMKEKTAISQDHLFFKC